MRPSIYDKMILKTRSRVGLALILTSVMLFACQHVKKTSAQNHAKTSLAKITWILGKWTAGVKDGDKYTIWSVVNDSTWQNNSYEIKLLSNKREDDYRISGLIYRNGILYYTEGEKGKTLPSLQFKITVLKKDEFVAANPKGEYLKQIGYKLRSIKVLMGWVVSDRGGKETKSEFIFDKVEN